MTHKTRVSFIPLAVAGTTMLMLCLVAPQLWGAKKPAPKKAAKPTPTKVVPKPEPVTTRIVPIISVGKGIRVGVAQITGPASRVKQAEFVSQLETTYEDVVRIRIFVPVKTKQGLDRVPQVNVNGYADLKL